MGSSFCSLGESAAVESTRPCVFSLITLVSSSGLLSMADLAPGFPMEIECSALSAETRFTPDTFRVCVH